MHQPITTRRDGGEYSTILLPDGVIETMWFPDEGAPVTVDRQSLRSIAMQHITRHEQDRRDRVQE